MLDEPGNLYLHLRLRAAAQAVTRVTQLLDQARLLKDTTREALQGKVEGWLKDASAIEDLTAHVACADDGVTVTVSLECANL